MAGEITAQSISNFDQLVLAAVFLQMLLTIALVILMGQRRVAALQKRQVRMSEIALATDKYPDAAKKAGNALNNQFQLPVMFYALVAILLILGHATHVHVWLAWAFVLSRLVHAFIHISSNNVNFRFAAYLLGVFILTGFIFSVFWPVFF